MKRLAAWVLERCYPHRLPDETIGGFDDPYMLRWFLIPKNHVLNIMLHKFLRSDDDRALHDHPWWNVSFLLRGRYYEHTISAGGVHHKKLYKEGALKFRSARYAHRIELLDGYEGYNVCWSLFITGPKIRSWGFHCPNGWRHWKQYTVPGRSGEIGRGCE